MSMSSYYLPFDLWTFILKKLPEEMIPPLRMVCRSWKEAIVEILLGKRMILFKSSTTAGGDIFSLKFDGPSYPNNIIYRCPFIPSSPLGFKVVGSCHGVVCLLDKINPVILWNPLTKRCLRIPQPPNLPNLPTNSAVSKAYGFGFDSSTRGFCVALLCWKRTPGVVTPPTMMIFSTASGQWTVAAENPPWGGSYGVLETGRQAFLKGKIHWIGYSSSVHHEQKEITAEQADQIFRTVGHSCTPADGFNSVVLSLDVSNGQQEVIELRQSISFMFPVTFSLGLWGDHTLALIRHSNHLNHRRTVRVYVLHPFGTGGYWWEWKCYMDGTGICDAFGLTTSADLLATIQDEPFIITNEELDEEQELDENRHGPLCAMYAGTYFETRCSLGQGEEAAAMEVGEGIHLQDVQEAVLTHEREMLIATCSLMGYSIQDSESEDSEVLK